MFPECSDVPGLEIHRVCQGKLLNERGGEESSWAPGAMDCRSWGLTERELWALEDSAELAWQTRKPNLPSCATYSTGFLRCPLFTESMSARLQKKTISTVKVHFHRRGRNVYL